MIKYTYKTKVGEGVRIFDTFKELQSFLVDCGWFTVSTMMTPMGDEHPDGLWIMENFRPFGTMKQDLEEGLEIEIKDEIGEYLIKEIK